MAAEFDETNIQIKLFFSHLQTNPVFAKRSANVYIQNPRFLLEQGDRDHYMPIICFVPGVTKTKTPEN